MAYSPGQVIDGRYRIIDKIGQGGHGTVYRAEDVRLSSEVAMKFLHPEVAEQPGFAARMEREARAMGQLAGTSAAQILGFEKSSDGSLYIVMEYLEGHDLAEHLRVVEEKGGRLPVREMIDILEPIVDTLEVAHSRAIIHRDLKPANIFLLDRKSRGAVRLLDFGLARLQKVEPLTQDGIVAGSPSYIAPECWLGRSANLDHRVDVYSLGVVVFRVLTGKMPFNPKLSLAQLLFEVTQGPRPSLHQLRPDLPKTIDDWKEKALAAAAQDRFQSVRTELNVLKVILGVS